MLEVSNLEYKSFATLAFQRVSVIVSDLVLAGGVVVAASNVKLPMGRNVGHGSEATRNHLGLLVLTNAGLLMVDHIHFQVLAAFYIDVGCNRKWPDFEYVKYSFL